MTIETLRPAEQSDSQQNPFLQSIEHNKARWLSSVVFFSRVFRDKIKGYSTEKELELMKEGMNIAAYSFAFMEVVLSDDRKNMNFEESIQHLEKTDQPILALTLAIIAKRASEKISRPRARHLLRELKKAQLKAFPDRAERKMAAWGMDIIWENYPLNMLGRERVIAKNFILPNPLVTA